jgi:hypothetical protein
MKTTLKAYTTETIDRDLARLVVRATIQPNAKEFELGGRSREIYEERITVPAHCAQAICDLINSAPCPPTP